jgi:hypothetical protein
VSVSNLSFPYFNPTQAIANVNGTLFFLADDGFHGMELWMIPADQIEDLKDHKGGGHHEGNDASNHDINLRYRDAAITLASSSGQRPLGIPTALTWNSPSIPSGRGKSVASPALVSGPLGPLGSLRPRAIPDLAHSQRWPLGSLAAGDIARPS